MNKRLRHLQLRSAQTAQQSRRRMMRLNVLFEQEIKSIEGEDPLWPIQKSSGKQMSK
jgi:hypothetical protein